MREQLRAGRRLTAGVVIAGVILAACEQGGGDEAPPVATDPIELTPSTSVAQRPADGRLSVGLLLPLSGDGAAMGQDLSDAARRALLAINAVGGVRGRPIEIYETEDEGETAADATSAVRALLDRGVDAVIGPASSTSALATLHLLLGARVLTCSPTATALALDSYPDSQLFVRTAPSDSLQAIGLAQLAELTGRTTVVVTWLDDVYGRPLAAAVSASLKARPTITVEREVPFTAASDPEAIAAEVLAARPGVVIVVADADHGSDVLTALNGAVSSDPTLDTPDIIVNDAMRIPPSRQVIVNLAPEFRSRIKGLSPAASGVDDLPGAFATNAYDCATLIALAAEIAGPDDPADMRAVLAELSDRGGVCRDFESCARAIAEGRNVDYEGPTGPVQIGTDGDPVRARFDTFSYGDDGSDRTESTGIVSR